MTDAPDAPGGALAALKAALAAALAEARAVPPGDDLAAFRFVSGLDEALHDLPELLETLPALARGGDLGRDLVAHFEETTAELARMRADLAADRRRLDGLRPALDAMKATAAEHAAVRAELAELHRLDALRADLDALRAQRDAFDARLPELNAARDAEDGLDASATALLRLTGAQLDRLNAQVREAVQNAADAEAELTAARRRLADERAAVESRTAELASLADGFTALQADAERLMPALARYRDADRALLDGLARGSLVKSSGLQRARDALDLVERTLEDLDAALAAALEIHDHAHAEARRVLPLT
jgi:chromosome segregation ATPase